MNYGASLCRALHRCFQHDSSVYLLGEDVVDPYGGAFKITEGLSSKYPDRVFSTPISEAAITGLASGMALRGLRPVVEIMFGDFITLCMDQLVNSASKFPLMYPDNGAVPLVVRTPMGGVRGYGPTHSQSIEKILFGVPGLTVVAVDRLSDPGILLEKAILEDTSPVLFIEDKGDYSRPVFEGPATGLSVTFTQSSSLYSTARVSNFESTTHAPDLTVVSYGGAASITADIMLKLATEEIRIIMYCVRALNDRKELKLVVKDLPKNKPVLVVEQGTNGFSWASEVFALMIENGVVTAPVMRLGALETVIPASRSLEKNIVVTEDRIKQAMMEMLLI